MHIHIKPMLGGVDPIGFVDDCSLLAQSTGGMQALMDTVQEFEEWSGMKVKLKKTCMLIIDGNKERRKVSGRVTYNGVPVRVLGENTTNHPPLELQQNVNQLQHPVV
jgi:uncharacterized protein (DUF2235 family)